MVRMLGSQKPKAADLPKPALAWKTGGSVVIDCCQVCGSRNLVDVMYYGYMPPVNEMQNVGSVPRQQPSYPCGLIRCTDCELVQLGLSIDPAVLFPPSYPHPARELR
jgi:hypothetical protein